MIIEQKMQAVLATVAGCTFYQDGPDIDVDASVAAYGSWSKIGGTVFGTLNEGIALSRARVTVAIYALTRGGRATLENAVAAAMDTANGLYLSAIDARAADPISATGALPNDAVSVPVNMRDPDTRRFVSHLDYYCWVKE